MIIAGLDFSYTSPAVTVYDGDYKFYGIRAKKKQSSSNPNLILLEYPELYKSQEERFDKLTDIMFDICYKHKVQKVFIEGYSYGSVGNVFDIAEATGLMKWKLMKSNIDFEIVPPTSIKKFATGKGNCNKMVMLEFFCQQNDHGILLTDIEADISAGKIPKPLDDIIDSYWLAKYGINSLQPGKSSIVQHP